MDATNTAKVATAFKVLAALSETIRDLGEIPSGELYAQTMAYLDHEGYEAAIKTLIRAGLVERTDAHLLRWIGPTL